MNCRHVRSLLSAYVDGELTGHEMLALRDHLSRCRECRDEHYSLKTMKYLLRALPEKDPRPEWVAYLAQSVGQPSPTVRRRLRGQWVRTLDAVAALFARSLRETAGIKSPSLALALTLSAVAVFAVVAPFDRPAAQAPESFAAPRPASLASWPVGPNPYVHPVSRKQDAGAYQFIPIPLPAQNALGSGAPVIMPPPAPMVAPNRASGDLTNVDFRQMPPAGFNSFNSPWSGARLPVSPIGAGH